MLGDWQEKRNPQNNLKRMCEFMEEKKWKSSGRKEDEGDKKAMAVRPKDLYPATYCLLLLSKKNETNWKTLRRR